jgi:predicted NBD/HSP70 family sugar kinase
MSDTATRSTIARHGATQLPGVLVDSYNLEIKEDEGFLGDRANKGAFRELIENWRRPLRKDGNDPLGKEPSAELSKKALDDTLDKDSDIEAAGITHGAIEDFSQELARIVKRFLKLKSWQDTERIIIGGGFRGSRVGELAIGRTSVLLKVDGVAVEFVPVRNDPNEAGLLGAAQLAPKWLFKGYEAILGVDIGGTNIRAGIVDLNLKKADDLSKAKVWKYELWRHADEKDVDREDAVDGLVRMLKSLIKEADKEKLKLAPFVGIGCPGKIEPDGLIDRGAQNLPGNWESSRFNLPAMLLKAIPEIDGEETAVVMHNDAVVQGLSERPFMADVEHWGVLTIGTGLGNARFTNRSPNGN